MEQILKRRIWRGVWVAFLVIALLVFIYFAYPLVYPFLIGWVLAYILNPFVNFLQRRAKFPRWLAVLVSLLVFLGIMATVIVLLIANVIVEISSLSEHLQETINYWKEDLIGFANSEPIQNLINRVTQFYSENPQYHNTIQNNLDKTTTSLADFGSLVVTGILNWILHFFTSLPSKATVTIISVLAAFFISKDWYKIQTKVASWLPDNVKKALRAIWGDLQKALFGYVRAQLLLVSITAIINMIGLMIMRVEYALTIGFLVGLIDLVPYAGTAIVMVPWAIYEILQGELYIGIGIAVLYSVGLIARQVLEPKILASNLGLEPLPLLIAMFAGLQLFGIGGLLIGPVTLIVLFALHRAGVFRDIRNYIVKGTITD